MSENIPTPPVPPTSGSWNGGYPPPPPPPRRTGVLVSIAVGSVLVLAAVLVTGLGWPGWAKGGRAPVAAGGVVSTSTATGSRARPHAGPVTNACTLLSAAQVQQRLGITEQLRPEPQGPIHDPVTDTAAYLCTFTGADAVLGDVEVADYPKNIDAAQLVRGVGSTGTDARPVTGVGDVAETVSDLGHANNRALIAVRNDPAALHLIVVVVNEVANPTVSQLTQLVQLALDAA